jgi:hypothetical protein
VECERNKEISGGPIYIKRQLLDGERLKKEGITILRDIYRQKK